ncbi:MAG: DUF4965 domain-containing protein, partial [Clostridia bacterium]|nr:DUF4965 domain-containing protein [Clostridia bacterium]
TPTQTKFVSEFGGVQVTTVFATPAFPDDLDLLSMPVTLVDFSLATVDGQAHQVELSLFLSDKLCYEGELPPKMTSAAYPLCGQNAAWCGQVEQKPLCHSGDHITIDWGYLYLVSPAEVNPVRDGLRMTWQGEVQSARRVTAVIAYDDISSINYIGDLCKAWYRRNGAQITDAIETAVTQFDAILARCDAWDARVLADALAAAGEDYAKVIAAAWRHTFAAHTLLATPKGEMVFLSKVNDSNGCLGTADVSYPSIPMFLKYAPELVNALALPILEFAAMPVWTDDFAPHDVGRYPHATGQVYAAIRSARCGETHPPYYLFPAGAEVYNPRYQMPVEECGNMLVMLAAAQHYGADQSLAEKYRPLLDKWVQYLVRYGEDPGEQLCTDDFAGHLAHNANLAAKAIVGVACYGRLIGDPTWEDKARDMAARFLEKVGPGGNTPLTLDGQGWSQKYNLLWDKVLGLKLLPDSFYAAEIASYIPRMNRYGLPLDSRADYTKSDWIAWCAAMTGDMALRKAFFAPMATYLAETTTRVPFSDWYDTVTGRYEHFIARPVQGGLFAPMLL